MHSFFLFRVWRAERYPDPGRHKVRQVSPAAARGTGGLATQVHPFVSSPCRYACLFTPLSVGASLRQSDESPLVFISCPDNINVQKVFKIVLSKVFDLKLAIEPISEIGEPLVEF